MLPDPIHPAIVHLPVALAILLPLMIGGAFLLARRGTPIRTLWTGVVAAAALLAGSAWLAVETGERQEERVEQVVSEGALERMAREAGIPPRPPFDGTSDASAIAELRRELALAKQ